jgi:hypothetical protein
MWYISLLLFREWIFSVYVSGMGQQTRGNIFTNAAQRSLSKTSEERKPE